MGAVCCHTKAKLGCTDKIANCLLGCSLPLHQLAGVEGLPKEQQLERVRGLREKYSRLGDGAEKYKASSSLAKYWNVEVMSLPRPLEQGGDIPIVVHIPKGGPSGMAAVLHAHGGGMIIGDEFDTSGVTVYTRVAEELVKADKNSKAFCWVSIGYRLAPEHQFPKAIDDLVYLYEAMMDTGKAQAWGYPSGKVGFSGISAGGWLAGHASVRMAKAGKTPAFCALINPVIDPFMDKPSYKEYDLPVCPTPFVNYSWHALLDEAPGKSASDARKREASLLHLEWEACKDMPVLNATAAYEIFYDDGLELNKTLQAAGAELTPIVADGSHIVCLLVDRQAASKISTWYTAALQL